MGSTFYVHLPVYNRKSDPTVAEFTPEDRSIFDPCTAAISHLGLKAANADIEMSGSVADVKMFDEADIETGAKKLQVLIVDDSSANRSAASVDLPGGALLATSSLIACRKIVRRMLERKDNVSVLGEYHVIEADDGVTGLDAMQRELAEGRGIDLVLIDYIMINMNGPEAVRKMRTELGYTGPVVGITGNALPEDIAFFKAHAADSVIMKPLTNAKLFDTLGQFL